MVKIKEHHVMKSHYCRKCSGQLNLAILKDDISWHLVFAILENLSKPSHLIFHDFLFHFTKNKSRKTQIIGAAKISYNCTTPSSSTTSTTFVV